MHLFNILEDICIKYEKVLVIIYIQRRWRRPIVILNMSTHFSDFGRGATHLARLAEPLRIIEPPRPAEPLRHAERGNEPGPPQFEERPDAYWTPSRGVTHLAPCLVKKRVHHQEVCQNAEERQGVSVAAWVEVWSHGLVHTFVRVL